MRDSENDPQGYPQKLWKPGSRQFEPQEWKRRNGIRSLCARLNVHRGDRDRHDDRMFMTVVSQV
jgi:hypothetical protein